MVELSIFHFLSLLFCYLHYSKISFHSHEKKCHPRSKFKFTRGTPSDSLAFVNAFKVKYTAKVYLRFSLTLWQVLFFNTIVFCLCPPGLDHSQEERSAQTPKGGPNTEKRQQKKQTSPTNNFLPFFFVNVSVIPQYNLPELSLVSILKGKKVPFVALPSSLYHRTSWTGEKRTSFRSRGSERYFFHSGIFMEERKCPTCSLRWCDSSPRLPSCMRIWSLVSPSLTWKCLTTLHLRITRAQTERGSFFK